MQRSCDICGKREATRAERAVENNIQTEYAYCEACYAFALKSGRLPREMARERLAKRGRECPECGCTLEKFKQSYMLGCPDCYRNMRQAIAACVRPTVYMPRPVDDPAPEWMGNYVVSSRVRFARNVEGVPFPGSCRDADRRIADIVKGACAATQGVFDAQLHTMTSLSDLKKKMLIERHVISLGLANSDMGAVILEKTEPSELSVMLNEEDHIREQCTVAGFGLRRAYDRLKAYDNALAGRLNIARDAQFGYLTACPSNVGTGMRASVMLFLPALKRTGMIDRAISAMRERYGLTVRGYYGEGSDAAYDMYQLSNSTTFGIDEGSILRLVEQSAVEMVGLEREALVMLLGSKKTEIIDKIFRSYGVLSSAYSISAAELMEKLVDVKLGVILGMLPIKDIASLNELIWACASSLEILNGDVGEEEHNIARARLVRKHIAEEK